MAQLFGTDGIRGRANVYPMTPEIAMRVGRAVARVLGAKSVVVGKDTRESGVMLENAISAGLVSEGVDVRFTGVLPTPAVALMTRETDADAGIMLTASHNPFEDNGIKIFGPEGFKLTDEEEDALEAFILGEEEQPASTQLGELSYLDEAAPEYGNRALASVAGLDLEGMKIVLDCAHGAAHEVAPQIFAALGAEIFPMGIVPDGKNINDGVGALHPEKAAERVLAEGADLGICFDGDADRVIFVDEKGQVVSGDRVLCFSAKELHRRGQLAHKTLVATVMSNLGLKESLAEEGITLTVAGVGDRHVLEEMRRSGFNFGGENSGHLIFSDYATTGDGIMSALMVLSFMKENSQRISELADCMTEYPSLLVNIPVKEKPPLETVPELHQSISEAEATLGDNGRVLVRYSGTEKKIRVFVEAKDEHLAQQQCDAIVSAVQNTIAS